MVKKSKWLPWPSPTTSKTERADKLKDVRRRTDAKLKQERARKERQGEEQQNDRVGNGGQSRNREDSPYDRGSS